MVGTFVGLKAAYWVVGSWEGEMGEDSFSNRGFNGLSGIPGSGNLLSGDREPSGDRDSLRMGLDVDILCAF
jgi:hypothetical protein